MPLRPPAGFIRVGYDPLKNPDAPTGVSASAGDASASVSFTAPANVGGSAISAYYAVSNPGGITGTAASSPVSVTGLTNGTAYTFQVWALNSYGPGVWSAATGSVTPTGVLALFVGGSTGASNVNTITYVTISTLGNSQSFGTLNYSADIYQGSAASTTRAVYSAGGLGNFYTYSTFATQGNTVNFAAANIYGAQGCNSSTRGLYGGGETATSAIYYITIATTGTVTSFGGLTNSVQFAASCSSPTRGIWAGGGSGTGDTAAIGYVTIATTGNATSFGSLLALTARMSACSNATRGIFSGGYNSGGSQIATIQYITIASTGNATSFGSLISAVARTTASASSTRALVSGGLLTGSAPTNVIQYVTIDTTGNAASFGSLTSQLNNQASASSGNGGTQ